MPCIFEKNIGAATKKTMRTLLFLLNPPRRHGVFVKRSHAPILVKNHARMVFLVKKTTPSPKAQRTGHGGCR